MNDYRYIRITYLPIWGRAFSKVYVLQAYLEQDSDHRWNAWIDALPGCSAWGHTREEALKLSDIRSSSILMPALKRSERHYLSVRSGPCGIALFPSPPRSGGTFSDLWITFLGG
jgi:hypothetical protein